MVILTVLPRRGGMLVITRKCIGSHGRAWPADGLAHGASTTALVGMRTLLRARWFERKPAKLLGLEVASEVFQEAHLCRCRHTKFLRLMIAQLGDQPSTAIR
jgi:hypothetical protein